MIMEHVREYSEGLPVDILKHKDRPIIVAANEGGYNSVQIDLIDVITWIKLHRPELIND